MEYLMAFLVGGFICSLGQIFLDNTKYTTGHLMVLLVVIASILTGLGLYDQLISIGGAGATTPVSNFGYILTRGVVQEARRDGLLGLLSGVLEIGSAGISASILFAFLIAILFRPRE